MFLKSLSCSRCGPLWDASFYAHYAKSNSFLVPCCIIKLIKYFAFDLNWKKYFFTCENNFTDIYPLQISLVHTNTNSISIVTRIFISCINYCIISQISVLFLRLWGAAWRQAVCVGRRLLPISGIHTKRSLCLHSLVMTCQSLTPLTNPRFSVSVSPAPSTPVHIITYIF